MNGEENAPRPLVVGRAVRFQRLVPNADGGVERGTGGCWANGLVVVRLVARIGGRRVNTRDALDRSA